MTHLSHQSLTLLATLGGQWGFHVYVILGTRQSSDDRKKAMFMKRFTRPFRRLQGKLTLSYTLTSVVTFLLIEVTLITILLVVVSLNISAIVLNNLKQEALQAAPYYIHGSPDQEALATWLHIIEPTVSNLGSGNNHPIFLSVVDTQGKSIASIGTLSLPLATPVQTELSPRNRAHLIAVLHDGKGRTSTVEQDTGDTLVAITPIVGQRAISRVRWS